MISTLERLRVEATDLAISGGEAELPEYMRGREDEVDSLWEQAGWIVDIGENQFAKDRLQKAVEQVVLPTVIEANVVAERIESNGFNEIRERMEGLGDKGVELGLVGCIDGRLYSVLQAFPRLMAFLKTPAGLVTGVQGLLRKSEGRVLPPRIGESIKQRQSAGIKYVEILTAHVSLKYKFHGCGAFTAAHHERVTEDSDHGLHFDLIREKRKATRELFAKRGATVIDAIINTDDQSMILLPEGAVEHFAENPENDGLSENAIEKAHEAETVFYTGKFARDNREKLEQLLEGQIEVSWDDPREFLSNLEEIVKLAELIDGDELGREIEQRLRRMYPRYTEGMVKELKSHVLYNLAVIQLSGFNDPGKSLPNRFVNHGERFAVVGDKGFDFSSRELPFLISTSEGDESVRANIRIMTKLLPGILKETHGVDKEKEAMVVYVAAPIKVEADGRLNGEARGRVVETLTRQYAMVAGTLKNEGYDPTQGEVMLVPVIVDQKTRRVMEIVDLTDYL